MREPSLIRARDVMTHPVRCCARQDSLERVVHLMLEHDVGCLVVTDDKGQPAGMITDRDVAIAAYTHTACLSELLVDDAMVHHVRICGLSTSLNDVEEIMRTGRVHRVPVVDSEGVVAGIISLSDLARHSQLDFSFAPEMAGIARTLAVLAAPKPALP